MIGIRLAKEAISFERKVNQKNIRIRCFKYRSRELEYTGTGLAKKSSRGFDHRSCYEKMEKTYEKKNK